MLCCLVAQSCPTPSDPMDCSLSGSSVHGDSLDKNTGVGRCPPPGDLPDPGIESPSLTSPALTGRFFTTSAAWEVPNPILTNDKTVRWGFSPEILASKQR